MIDPEIRRRVLELDPSADSIQVFRSKLTKSDYVSQIAGVVSVGAPSLSIARSGFFGIDTYDLVLYIISAAAFALGLGVAASYPLGLRTIAVTNTNIILDVSRWTRGALLKWPAFVPGSEKHNRKGDLVAIKILPEGGRKRTIYLSRYPGLAEELTRRFNIPVDSPPGASLFTKT